ncbi:hypothetical protein GFK26_18805 [Variovorax paradoxus]|uniref:Uncharacterized protein n=1 Tax=Variovorax paradoxus TaxID=34073 RepID=A0A5Q0M562_VARPD|nr:hypothetical protein GFK26_18805 [Variovorax paradoxus]
MFVGDELRHGLSPWKDSGRNCPRPEAGRRSAAVRVRETAAGRKRTTCAQTLTGRTPCNDEGNSKASPPLPRGKRSAQAGSAVKAAGVRDGSPKGRDAAGGSMRSTTARPGTAGRRTNAFAAEPYARRLVKPVMRLCTMPRVRRTASAHPLLPAHP